MDRDAKAAKEKAELAKKEELSLKAQPEFVDDYERPVLEKYEKISPTPLTKKKEKAEVKVRNRIFRKSSFLLLAYKSKLYVAIVNNYCF